MAYKTKSEKRAYRTGLLNGLFRKKKKPRKIKKTKSTRRASRHKIIKRRIGQGSRNRKLRLFGDFEYDSRGRIKGSYIDGRFEPD